jgi:NCAIR mutase (PurE)-related protein
MTKEEIRAVLEQLAAGTISTADAERALESMPTSFVDMGDIKLDTGRRRRRGVSEAIFCQGKTREQVLDIVTRLDADGQTVICTRVVPETADYVRSSRPDFEYHAKARVLSKKNETGSTGVGMVVVLTAGTTDIPVAEEAALCLELWGNQVNRIFDAGVAGIQRLFANLDVLQSASVIIVAAGMEAALPSVVAGLVRAPVIAVPTSVGYGASFGGVTALLGMLNSCSGGIATVNIDNGFGAALLAHMINHVGQPTGNGTAQ